MKFISKKLLTTLVIISTLSIVGCGSSKKAPEASASADTAAVSTDGGLNLEVNGDSDSEKAGALKTVYFGFNSSSLTDSAKADLNANAEFLKMNTTVSVQVEGHCDERGGVQFNVALGEKRAQATKDYLVSAGVDSSRVSTISYGKERPVAFGHDDSAWSQNRRSNFVVLAK